MFGTLVFINSLTRIPSSVWIPASSASCLFAAIPATVFYNLFVGRLREIHSSIELFAEELEGDFQQADRPATSARAVGS